MSLRRHEGMIVSKVEPVVKIENVVATAALKHGIDLQAVVKALPDVGYRPGRFPGLVFRLKRPMSLNSFPD